MKLCLNSIVKNEAARIERMLESVAPFISCWVIMDTGSTDGTPEKIEAFMKTLGIPGHLMKGVFQSFEQARNDALDAARRYRTVTPYDYMLLVDADMELVVKDHTVFDKLEGPSLDMYQQGGTIKYLNRRLLRADVHGYYRTPTHEYLDVPSSGCLPYEQAFFVDHMDGSNRPDKFKRDIELLKAALEKEPKNERCMYYLAQSYRDCGKFKKAAKWYRRRIEAGGWEEEVWSARMCLAVCLLSEGDEAGFIREMLEAYNFRPSRAETVHALARHYRQAGKNQLGALFAMAGMSTPMTNDGLFVDRYAYEAGCKEEFSICAYYTNQRQLGFMVANELAVSNHEYPGTREVAKTNLYWYAPMLKEFAPSFQWKQIHLDLEDGWTAMNPSIMNFNGRLCAVVRTVNYRMDEQGRYLIRGTDGTANAENPINTRNFLVTIGDDLHVDPFKREIKAPEMPCEFPLVIGQEDMRLYAVGDDLHVSATVRQIHPDGNCEQVRTRLVRPFGLPTLVLCEDMKRMLRHPRLTEKNWMPIQGATHRFVYRLGHIVDKDGQDLSVQKLNMDIEPLRGGSQMIQFPGGGFICLVHEARFQPNTHLRWYMHRFVWWDGGTQWRATFPFVFNDKVIEYAAGMCLHPTEDKLVISYGYKDEEARLATVAVDEVRNLLGLGNGKDQSGNGLRPNPGASAVG